MAWRVLGPAMIGGSASPSATTVVTARVTSLASRTIWRYRLGTALVNDDSVRVWACPACRVLTPALKATLGALVISPARSSTGRATPSNRINALPFSVYRARVVVAWKDGIVPHRSLWRWYKGRTPIWNSVATGRHKSLGVTAAIGLNHSTIFQLTMPTASPNS